MKPPTQPEIDAIYKWMSAPYGLDLRDAAARARIPPARLSRWLRDGQRDDGHPACQELLAQVLEAEAALKSTAMAPIMQAIEEGSTSDAKWLLRNRCGMSEGKSPSSGLQELAMSGEELAEPGTLDSLLASLRACQMQRQAAAAQGSHVAAQRYMADEVRLQELIAEREAQARAEADAARSPDEVLASVVAVVDRLPVTLREQLLAKLGAKS